MGTIAVVAEHQVDLPVASAFALFGRPDAGWLFAVECDQVVAGACVTLRLPVVGVHGRDVTVLGRISRVISPRQIDLVHDYPWQGSIRIRFEPVVRQTQGVPGATRIRVIADLGQNGLKWLLHHRGVSTSDPVEPGAQPVGLLLSKSGPGAVFSGASGNLAALAEQEINADGGVNGRSLQVLVGDDATDPATGVAEARRLVQSGCLTILAATTSASFLAVAAALRGSGILLVHALMNEGGASHELCLRLGERPTAQLEASIDTLQSQTGGRRWFMAGNDYIWPRAVHKAAQQAIAARGAHIAGQAFAPLGTRDFGTLIHTVQQSGAELLLSSFVGADQVAFERQCHATGVRQQMTTLALALDEPTRERIGDSAAAGLWGVAGYFEEVGGYRNRGFLERYRTQFGPMAPPVSSIAEATYEALHLYADASRRAGESEPRSVARAMRSSRISFPRGRVLIEGPEAVSQDLYVVQAESDGFAIRDEVRA